MSDPISLLLGEPEETDNAASIDSTATEDEGANESLLAALEGLDTPEDDGSTDDVSADATDEEIDYKAELERLKQERDAERQQFQTAEHKRAQDDQLRMMKEAQLAWQQEEQSVIHRASQMETWEQASAELIRYYQGKLAQQAQAAQLLLADAYSGQYVQQVAKDTGLTEEDAALLAAVDAKHQPKLAKALAAKNKQVADQLAEINGQLKQLKRGQQSNRRALTGADRSSSAHGTAPQRKIVDGSNDHALLLMQATQALRTRR